MEIQQQSGTNYGASNTANPPVSPVISVKEWMLIMLIMIIPIVNIVFILTPLLAPLETFWPLFQGP